jgi:hypothetical protein
MSSARMKKVAYFDIGGTLGDVSIIPGPRETDSLKLEVFPGILETLNFLIKNKIRLGLISKIGDFHPDLE